MLKQLQKTKDQKGFTIIEVLIVLAIAGLILLIVFLAVPNLQRNSRNTTIKNDANVLGGGIAEFQANNGGSAPNSATTDIAVASGVATITNAALASPVPTKIKVSSGTTVVYKAVSGTTPVGVDPATAGTIWVYGGYSCDGTKSTRAFSLVYDIETAGGLTATCADR
jgi:prepilin-type N-terminal cleavage/methylation domain-containing protein